MAFDPDGSLSRCLVAITAINLDTNTYAGYNQQVGSLAIHSAVQPGGHVTIPVVGEQWLVEKIAGQWFLYAKTDWNDARTQIPNEQGLDIVGTMSGPTYVTGSRVELPQTVWLSGVEIRVDPTTHKMQYRSGDTWLNMAADATGTTSGTVPTRVSYIQTLAARVVGVNQVIEGVRPGPCTLTEVTYEFGTADAGGSTVVELRKNGVLLTGSQLTVSAANQATGSGTEAARTATGTWTFGKNDSLLVNIVSVGTTPGSRLTAHCYGTVALL